MGRDEEGHPEVDRENRICTKCIFGTKNMLKLSNMPPQGMLAISVALVFSPEFDRGST